MQKGYVGVVVTLRPQAVPVAMAVQSAGLLACNAAELRRAIDELVLTNPMVEPLNEDGCTIPPAETVAAGETLGEHLSQQLRLTVRNPRLLCISDFIVNMLDRDGYLREDPAVILLHCRCTAAEYEAALQVVQKLEPIGVGARDLQECLLLQLRAMEPVDPLAIRIVTDHLEALAGHALNLPNETDDAIESAIHHILSLNPRPGTAFDTAPIPYLLPDILVEEEQGQLTVSLTNQPVAPSLCPEYAALARAATAEEKQYIREKLAAARSFLFSLQQRSSTLLAVAVYAMEVQGNHFLQEGIPLQALTLSAAAEALQLNVSTVSRAVKDKYVQFGSRIFPMRSLFPSGGIGELSRPEILEHIRHICRGHGKISDQAVADLLAEDGIHIARRTVNKYRKLLLTEGGRL